MSTTIKPTLVVSARVLCLLVSFLASTVAVAEMYQWRDKNGKLQFSDRKPPDVEAETVKVEALNIADELETRQPLAPQEHYHAIESHETKRKNKLKKICKNIQKEYIDLKGGTSARSKHTVLTREGKVISRREQNEIAEQFRQKANQKGCNIKQKEW